MSNNPVISTKQDQIVRLNKENGSLKQNFEETSKALSVFRIEGSGASTHGTNIVKVVFSSISNFLVECLMCFRKHLDLLYDL